MFKREFNLFFLALGFFSRIPMPKKLDYNADNMHHCTRYFPVIGWLLGALLIAIYLLAEFLFGIPVAIFLLMLSSVMLTGALHEDGLADTCDGFWGGMEQVRKLDIMKDSRIGTYGSCALVLVLLGKFALLNQLATFNQLWLVLVIAYPLSRAMAISHVQDLPYVSHLGNVQKNKSDPLAKAMSKGHLIFVLTSGALGLVLLPVPMALVLILTLFITRYILKAWMRYHIQGFTGDVLGTAQQIQEMIIYLTLLAMFRWWW